MKKSTLLFLLSLIGIIAVAQDKTIYQKRLFIRGNDTLRYRIMLPENYKPKKKYPVVLFLHGSGERGNDNELQLTHGWKLFADSANRKNFPAIVIFPQCPANDAWAALTVNRNVQPAEFVFLSDQPMNKPLLLVSQLMDSIHSSRGVDKKRFYIGGLSMGGMGTFDMLWRKPGFFAAAFPICGAGDSTKAAVYGKNFPIWVFHGADDPAVNVNNSRRMVSELKKTNANVKYTEYPGVKHDSWNNAFAEPELLPWLFQQHQ